ncbi:MAG: sulfite dehydrogenase subunit SoeC [Gammaproteobacteria bacterium]
MHPALSVILLTTLLGVGQGLFLALYTGQLYSVARLLEHQDSQTFHAVGSALALSFLAAGLIASFFHLGHPERAWRSIARWRTSWLSREVIVLPLVMLLVFLYGLFHYLEWTTPLFTVAGTLPVDATLIIGALATLATFALFICTAMIYASIRFLQEWHSALTVINFTLLGGASGFMLAAAFSAFIDVHLVGFYGTWAVILTLAALLTRGASLLRNHRLRPRSTLQSAIGVRHTRIRQIAEGAMGGSFNTREFFHHQPGRVIRMARAGFLVLVFPVPILLLGAAWGLSSEVLPLLAFLTQYLGLLIERWYFFVEARHPQNLYYQSIA